MDDQALRRIVAEVVAEVLGAGEADPLRVKVAAWVGRRSGTGAGAGTGAGTAPEVRITSTPARLGMGRAGVRYRTATLLRFLEDHAAARDAVTSAVDPAVLASLGLLPLCSAARDRTEYLLRPDLGRTLDPESIERVRAQAQQGCQVQIVVCDGLSAAAIGATLPRLLPPLLAALRSAGLTVGTPCFVQNGRLVVGDQVGRLVNADVLCTLLGERPGLVTAGSMGGYVTWLRVERIHEAMRRMISNVHAAGLRPEEGAHQLAALCSSAVRDRRTGVEGAG